MNVGREHLYVCCPACKSIHMCTHTDTKKYVQRYTCEKCPRSSVKYSHQMPLHLSTADPSGERGISLGSVVNDPPSCWAPEMSHSEGDVLQPRGSRWVSLSATLYRVASWLTLVVSKFPLWPQSRPVITGIFLEKSNNNIIPLRLLLR